MNWTEVLGFITGAASVLLAVKESAWNWPVGIANNLFFLVLFWKAKLYADALLQIVYMAISIFGWWNWLHGGAGRSVLAIRGVRTRAAVFLGLSTVACTLLLTLVLHRFTDSPAPFWDGSTTALSLTAQFMLSEKFLENWWVWMTADVIYVALYCSKSLYLTGILYAVFFGMCFAGYAGWRRSLHARSRAISQEAVAL